MLLGVLSPASDVLAVPIRGRTAVVPIPNRQAPVSTPASGVSSPAAPVTFDRYQIILARMPFGDEAAAAAAAAAAEAAAKGPPPESFTKNLKMCAITRNHFNGKIQVGLLDMATKKSYFFYEGDVEDGMELVKADYENEKALLRKGVEEAWMDMNAPTVVVASAPPGRPGAIPSAGMAPRPAVVTGNRREVLPPPKPIYTGEALEKHLKEYQMELIRAKGEKGPPLPMELTPEMDEQLVSEGVLPPAE